MCNAHYKFQRFDVYFLSIEGAGKRSGQPTAEPDRERERDSKEECQRRSEEKKRATKSVTARARDKWQKNCYGQDTGVFCTSDQYLISCLHFYVK